jgi:hypothetical protein
MCKCNNIGLLVVLGAQIHNAKSPQSVCVCVCIYIYIYIHTHTHIEKKEGDSIFNAFQQNCLAFLGHADD